MILSPSDVPTIGPMGEITYDLLKKLGMNAELAATDWATLTNRRACASPLRKVVGQFFIHGPPPPLSARRSSILPFVALGRRHGPDGLKTRRSSN